MCSLSPASFAPCISVPSSQRLTGFSFAHSFWQGLWCALFTLLLVAFDLCALMQYVTRFTEEVFAALITIIFILEAFMNVGKVNVCAALCPISATTLSCLQLTCRCTLSPILQLYDDDSTIGN